MVINILVRELYKIHRNFNPAPSGIVNAQGKSIYDQSLQYP